MHNSDNIDRLDSAVAIAEYLGWPGQEGVKKVYRARERKWSIPIRKREGMGVYAFKSELDSWLKAEESLPN